MLDALLTLCLNFLVEGLFYGVCYPVGWVMLRILTFGRYPPPVTLSPAREFIAGLPLVAGLVAAVVALS